MKTAIQEMEELCILREAREIFRVLGRISYQNLLIFWSKYERRSGLRSHCVNGARSDAHRERIPLERMMFQEYFCT